MHSLTTFHIHRLLQGWLVFTALPCSSSLLLPCWSTLSGLFLLFGIVRHWLETVFFRSGSRFTSGVEIFAVFLRTTFHYFPVAEGRRIALPRTYSFFFMSEARVTYITDTYFTCFNIVPKALGQLQLLSQLIFWLLKTRFVKNTVAKQSYSKDHQKN